MIILASLRFLTRPSVMPFADVSPGLVGVSLQVSGGLQAPPPSDGGGRRYRGGGLPVALCLRELSLQSDYLSGPRPFWPTVYPSSHDCIIGRMTLKGP